MSTVILEVRALEKRGNDYRHGSYLRAGHVFTPGWSEYVVEETSLSELQSDPWLEVRVLDVRLQAAKKKAAVLAARQALEVKKRALQSEEDEIDALDKEANAELVAVAKLPPLPPPPAPATPFQDSLMAAMPSAERAKLPKKK